MSYEVYVDVRHHPRHLDDWEQHTGRADRYEWQDGEPTAPLIAASLRRLADDLSPEPTAEADERRVRAALDTEIQRVRREWDSSPHSQRAILTSLLRAADALGLGEDFLPGVRSRLRA